MKDMVSDYSQNQEEGLQSEHWAEAAGWVIYDYGSTINTIMTNLWQLIYTYITLLNLATLLLKYIPTGIYMYKFTKSIYVASKERIKRKQIELEEIQQQGPFEQCASCVLMENTELVIQIANMKISVRDTEREERLDRVHSEFGKLRRLRARVRDVIARDAILQQELQVATHTDYYQTLPMATPEQESVFLMELLKEMKNDLVSSENMECGEQISTKTNTSDSVYSSVSDAELKKDCQIKIIKVPNAYKVAYLKHYIKQKRMRRANKQALRKKKMESIKKILEDWQMKLSMVINSKLTMLSLDPHPIDIASQEAMGDYSKGKLADSSESDKISNCNSDPFVDEYNMSSSQNVYNNYYCYDDVNGNSAEKNMYGYQEFGDTKFTNCSTLQNECNISKPLCSLPEETSSQINIKEIKDEPNERNDSCDDLVVL